MQLHQILTGSCNVKDQCISRGIICSFTFVAYGSGSDLVILNHDFMRHQIIQEKVNDNSQISAVSCSICTGKILVLYADCVYVYEPHNKIEAESDIGLNKFIWTLNCQIIIKPNVINDLCWIPKVRDTVILVGKTVEIWKEKAMLPLFSIGFTDKVPVTWNCIFKRNCPEIQHIERIKFSPDGKFFATFSSNSKEIFIWFWDHNSILSNLDTPQSTAELFDFIRIKHPTYIISFEWRNISHFLPRNSINNVLLTCSNDNVCRIWTESHLHMDTKSSNSEVIFSDHLKNIFFTFLQNTESKTENVSTSQINSDLKDKSTYEQNKLNLYPKFVLSVAINDITDFPIFSSINEGNTNFPLIIHWLDNKELDVTSTIECNLHDLASKVANASHGSQNEDANLTDKLSQFKRNVISALAKWKETNDIVFAIHPQNGSLLIWLIHNLDDSGGHSINNKALNINRSIYIKNAQISVDSCLPNCVPVADATTMCSNILLYCDHIPNKSFSQDLYSNEDVSLINVSNIQYDIKMISKQFNGSLNMWNLAVSSSETGNTSILNMKHSSRISGHRWQTNGAACHIQLPLLLTISNLNEIEQNSVSEISELILWRIKQVGPFSKSGGITEIARINSRKYLNFSNIAWFPGIIPSQFISLGISSPSSLFIASDYKNVLYIYLSITNAKDFLKNEIHSKRNSPGNFDDGIFHLVSLASTGEPGCILSAGILNTNSVDDDMKTIFLHVFSNNTIIGTFRESENLNDNGNLEYETVFNEIYYVVRIISKPHNTYQETFIQMWRIIITDSNSNLHGKSSENIIKLNINQEMVYFERLKLPEDTFILKAVPASGHLSSASIYPECLSPYLISLLCSDNSVRFYHCVVNVLDTEIYYRWQEWTMELTELSSSSILLENKCTALNISCAYSGRVAVAYSESIKTDINYICVDIYECESSGGSEWILEDCIKMKKKAQSFNPSILSEEEKCTAKKNSILIDWVNSEDGSHLLSVSFGTQFYIFSPSCSEITKYKHFESENFTKRFAKWMKVKQISLRNSNSLTTLPDHISWAREGLLIVGLNNELHVYNQWNDKINGFNGFFDTNYATDEYEFVDNDRDFTQIMKFAPNANFSIARLKDAYYSNNDFKQVQSKTYMEDIGIEVDCNISSDEFLQNSALFEAAQIHNPVLPQYHPKQLMEWINFGKISRVMAILSHLTNCTSGIILDTTFVTHKSTGNIQNQDKDSDDFIEKSQLEIKAIPPLPLHVLLEIDVENEKKFEKKDGDDIFTANCDEDVIMKFDILNEDDENLPSVNDSQVFKKAKHKPWMVFQSISDLLYFGPTHVRKLSESLTHIQLPGLSKLDQVYLLGIANLMSNFKGDYPVSPTFKHDQDNISDRNNQHQNSTNSMDDCGLRFLLAVQHFSYMSKALPPNQRSTLMDQGMDTSSVIWGFHSETEEELCLRLDEITSNGIIWSDFKRFGCGWWIRNDITLQRVIEKIAKNIFRATKDPMDAAIFYLAMGKQKLLSKLFRNCNKDGLETFFMLDFSVSENRSRALNQAFKMRSKRRYDHAVALFLLCKSIDDALLICLHNLKDIQMALTISRLYDINVTRNSKNLDSIINNHVIQSDDPFIRSMGYWMIKDYANSLDTLLQKSRHIVSESNLKNTYSPSDPAVFVFYNFLKKHPIIMRHRVVFNKTVGDNSSAFRRCDDITPMERRLFFRTAYNYLKMGSPDLALEVLSKLPEEMPRKNETSIKSDGIMEAKDVQKEVCDSGLINWDDFMDLPGTKSPEFKVSWNDENDESEKNYECIEKENIISNKLDIMCLQYKFMICLKLISEELCTLATGIETNGSYLRCNFYTWLEKEVQVLHYMCRHTPHNAAQYPELDSFKVFSTNQGILSLCNQKDNLKKHELEVRRLWLKTNHSLILCLYSFCSLRGPSIVGLASIRMELLILIQELQGGNCLQSDINNSLPKSVNLPFISSALSPDNGLIITPIEHLKTFVADIMNCINSFQCPFAFLFHHSMSCSNLSDNELVLNRNKIKLLRSQCQAMSACLHQCLSNFEKHNNEDESSVFKVSERIRHGSTNVIYSPESEIHLRSKKISETSGEIINPNTDPRNWPGLSNLLQIITSSLNKDIFNFSYLLGEALVVVYVGILVYALHLNDANLLYRLTNVEFNRTLWGTVFGGTLRKKPLRPTDPPLYSTSKESPTIIRSEPKNGSPKLSVSPCTARNRLYANLNPPIKQQVPAIEEKFIPPLHSILTAILEKPTILRDSDDFIYDSDDEHSSNVDDDDSDSEFSSNSSHDSECQNSKSYTWSLLRLIILYSSKCQVLNLVKLLQIENGELAIFCPNIFAVFKCLNQWESQCRVHLFNFPDAPMSYLNLLSECDIKETGEKSSRTEMVSTRINKICKQLTKKDKVPFMSRSSLSLSMKRLWINLIGNSKLQPLFIQQLLYLSDKINDISRSKNDESGSKLNVANNNQQLDTGMKSIKIIHKEHESIYSLAINQVNKSTIAACTSKEIIELNINNLTNPEKWMKDDFDYLLDIVKDPIIKESKQATRSNEYSFSNDFLLVTPTFGSHVNYLSQHCSEFSYVTLKRPISGVQILKSHPSLPYYLTGNSSGQVSVFEWANETPVVKTYSPIQKGKITSLNFDESGNKFGMGDSEGNFSLCHFSYADNSRAQYFNTRCPHKGVMDFCFLNSSSIVATCGGSSLSGMSSVNHLHAVSGSISTFDSNSINISIWDTLLPSGRNQVRSFSDPQLAVGVVSLCYSSRYEVLIVGTRKGEVAIIDLRQNAIQNIFQAHESSITSIKLDTLQFYFVSSSADGFIKIWNLYTQELLETYRNDPVKSSVFRQADIGIKGISILDDDKLLSCGADGFIRLRYMNPKSLNLNIDIDATSF